MLSMSKEEYEKLTGKKAPTRKPLPQGKTGGKQSTTNKQATPEQVPKKKPNKYRNTKIYVFADGFTSTDKGEQGHGKVEQVFDSRKEHERWLELKLLEKSGKIEYLKTQMCICIQPAFVSKTGEKIRAIEYKADFFYIKNGETIIEDVKGIDKKTGKPVTTKEFALKWKLLQALYPEYYFKIY